MLIKYRSMPVGGPLIVSTRCESLDALFNQAQVNPPFKATITQRWTKKLSAIGMALDIEFVPLPFFLTFSHTLSVFCIQLFLVFILFQCALPKNIIDQTESLDLNSVPAEPILYPSNF